MAQRSIPELYEWMKYLPNSYYLSEFSIPGTHQTCTKDLPSYWQCQIEDLNWQLRNGIRYIDIRLAIIDGGGRYGYFKVYHGGQYTGVTFGTVLTICDNFLKTYPSETIIMRVQQEHTTDNNRFTRIFNEYIKDYPVKFYLGNSVPMLSDARGKIVLISGGPWIEKGLNWIDQMGQDDYSQVSYDTKKEKVKKCMEDAVGNLSAILYINHLSGNVPPLKGPLSYSQEMNPWAIQFILDHYENARKLGVIVYDYAGYAPITAGEGDSLLAQTIIKRNYFPNWSPSTPAGSTDIVTDTVAMETIQSYVGSAEPPIEPTDLMSLT